MKIGVPERETFMTPRPENADISNDGDVHQQIMKIEIDRPWGLDTEDLKMWLFRMRIPRSSSMSAGYFES